MDILEIFFLVLAIAGTSIASSHFALGASWGPGVHIQLSRTLLHKFSRHLKPTPEGQLALHHSDHFFYGNIAADIINFKNYGGMKNHCHNWNIHERLEACISTDTERAFLLGYLCHLAADVTAHNYFVPYHLVRRLPPRYLGHPYWEALADGLVGDEDWGIIAAIQRNRLLRRNDRIIHQAVKRKALGMRSNKWIFNNITLISLRKAWRDFIRKSHRRENSYQIDQEFFQACWRRSFDDMVKVFDTDQLLSLKLQDPTGRGVLRGALRMRKELRRNHPVIEEAREFSEPLAKTVFASWTSQPKLKN